MRAVRIILAGAVALGGVVAACAQDIQFWYANQSGFDQLFATPIGPVGSPLALTIVAHNSSQFDVTINSGNVMLGLGTTTTQGTAATLEPGSAKILLQSTVGDSASFPYDPFLGVRARDLRGGRGTNGPARPWGYNVPIDVPLGTTTTIHPGESVRLFDVFLANDSLQPSEYQDLYIYNSGSVRAVHRSC